MKIYLSGPMTGIHLLNYPAFHAAAEHLRGIDVVDDVYNPAEWEERNNDGVFDLRMAFEDYCKYIIWEADILVVLPGWENSPGARAEMSLARALKKSVFTYSTFTGWASLPNQELDHDQLALFN